MNCKQGRFGAQMRWIERCMEGLEKPTKFSYGAGGDLRTLIPTAKLKELDNLISKLSEAKRNVQTESDQEWLNGVAATLKERVHETLNVRQYA